jgi:amino acid transporter
MYVMLGLIVCPLFYAFPVALMTAELSAALPGDGGFVVWVQKAFSQRLSRHVAWWTAAVFLVDAAVYPVLAAQYLLPYAGVRQSGGIVWVPLSIMAAMMLVRLAGSEVMVKVSAFVAFIAILPCLLFMAWGIKDVNAVAFTRTTGALTFHPCLPPPSPSLHLPPLPLQL